MRKQDAAFPGTASALPRPQELLTSFFRHCYNWCGRAISRTRALAHESCSACYKVAQASSL